MSFFTAIGITSKNNLERLFGHFDEGEIWNL